MSLPDMAKMRPAGRMRPSRLFLRPLSLKYLIPHSQLYQKIWLFKPKYDFLDYPLDICLTFGINLRPQEHSKLLKMAPE